MIFHNDASNLKSDYHRPYYWVMTGELCEDCSRVPKNCFQQIAEESFKGPNEGGASGPKQNLMKKHRQDLCTYGCPLEAQHRSFVSRTRKDQFP